MGFCHRSRSGLILDRSEEDIQAGQVVNPRNDLRAYRLNGGGKRKPPIGAGGGALPAFNPQWFSRWLTGDGSADVNIRDGGKWLGDFFSSGAAYMLITSGICVCFFDGTAGGRMQYAGPTGPQWPAPTAGGGTPGTGQYIFYSGVIIVHCPLGAAMDQSHTYQMSEGTGGQYFFFTHALENGDGTFRFQFHLPLTSVRYQAKGLLLDHAYVFNIRLNRYTANACKISIAIWDATTGAVVATDADFYDQDFPVDPTRRLSVINPDLAVPGGADTFFYGQGSGGGLQVGNNSDPGVTNGNYVAYDNLSVFVTANGNDWPYYRTPS